MGLYDDLPEAPGTKKNAAVGWGSSSSSTLVPNTLLRKKIGATTAAPVSTSAKVAALRAKANALKTKLSERQQKSTPSPSAKRQKTHGDDAGEGAEREEDVERFTRGTRDHELAEVLQQSHMSSVSRLYKSSRLQSIYEMP